MGLTEVITHLPRLMRLRARLRRQILDWRPDVFVGVDYKEFNLGLARQLKRAGLATVQYVSPQVWAWRQGRVRTIGESVDLVLCLFPFEPDFYREHGVRAAFVGHPLADQIPLEVDRAAARAELEHPRRRARARGVARQPARRSRKARRCVRRRGRVAGCARAGARDHRAHGDARLARPVCRALRSSTRPRHACACSTVRHAARSRRRTWCWWHRAPRRSKRRCSGARWWWPTSWASSPPSCCVRSGMVKIQHFSQPNLLAGKELVPEFFQEAASAENLANALVALARTPR